MAGRGRPRTAPQRQPAVSAREADAVHGSLNLQLGNLGGRQKSWMHSSSASTSITARPVASRAPNPPKRSQTDPHRRPLQPLGAPASPVTEDSHERAPASNSTSPQLANVVSDQRRRFSPTSNVFPSPAPSEDAPLDARSLQGNGCAPPVLHQEHAVNGHGTDLDAPHAGSGREEDMHAHNKRPAGNTTPTVTHQKRSRLATETRADIQPHQASATQNNTSLMPNPTNSEQHNSAPEGPESAASLRNSFIEPAARGQGSSQQVQQIAQDRPLISLPARANTAQGQPPLNPTHPLPVDHTLRSNATPSRGSPVIGSPINSSPQASPEYYTAADCWSALQQLRSSITLTSLNNRELQRLTSLDLAVTKEDWAYLTFHQYYCLLSLDRRLLTSKILNHPHLPHAIRLLEEVLDSNRSLSPTMLSFFATFPFAITHISINWPQSYAREQEAFHDFIARSIHYDALRHACQRLKRPPVVLELYHDLGIRSACLQKVVFMSILRRNWNSGIPHVPEQVEFEARASALLEQNQQDFMHRRHMWTLDTILEERGLDQQTWGARFHQLCLNYESWFQLHRASQSSFSSRQSIQTPTQAPVSRQPGPYRLPATTNTQQQTFPTPITATSAAEARRRPGRPRIYPQAQQVDRRRGSGQQPQQGPMQPREVQQFQLQGEQVQQVQQYFHQVQREQPQQWIQPTPKQDPRKLLPPPGFYRSQQTEPNPVMSALHQAGLQSPTLRAQGSESKLLQYVKGLAIPPTRLSVAGHQIESWKLPQFDLNTIPASAEGSLGAPSTRTVNENHQLYRLRCIKWPLDAKPPNDNTWAVADTSWPPLSYFTLNKKDHLHQRKKLNYGKDLPIDISSLVHDGDNLLDISILCNLKDLTWRNYLLAVEIVGFKKFDSIKKECLSTRVIPATHSLEKIKAKLAGNDDDEVSIVQSNVTISLIDPFSASQICDIPVRSKACTHFDCFDLEVFLQTRMSKGGDEASIADHWKCPICNGDARPHLLVVDGFLQEVRKSLAKNGLLCTRAITVGQDGSWKPKGDARDTSIRDTPEKDEPAPARSSAPAAGSHALSAISAAANEIEVIDLCD